MADMRGLTSRDGTLDTCSVLTCREGTPLTLPDSILREDGMVALTVVVRGESFSTSGGSLVRDAVVTCREETD